MNLQNKSTIDLIIHGSFEPYANRVPEVSKIIKAMIQHQIIVNKYQIINDHIAFRTLDVRHIGVKSIEKVFLHHGYQKRYFYRFNTKKLEAFWYSPPKENISQLRVKELSLDAQKIIDFFHAPLWEIPTLKQYNHLLEESEYATWVIYNRYYLNHYTISIHELPKPYNQLNKFNEFLLCIGIK